MKNALRLALIAIGFCALTNCRDADVTSDPVPVEAAPFKPPTFDETGLRQLDAGMRDLVRSGQVANVSYALSKNGAVVSQGFHGTLASADTTQVTADTPYRINQMTQPITAMALLMLYEEGKFSLDDPVSKFLPELTVLKVMTETGRTQPAARPPTMRELFHHTAGLGYGGGRPHPVHQAFDKAGVLSAVSSTQMVERVAAIPLLYDPGTDWSYSIASDVQGAVVERISGQSLADFMKARIFDPLGMASTGFVVSADAARKMPVVTARNGTSLIVADATTTRYTPAGVGFHHGGDGLVSTLNDYRKFADLLANSGAINGKVYLKPETFKLMTTNGVALSSIEPGAPEKRLPYGAGYGFSIGTVEDVKAFGGLAPNGTLYWPGALGTWFWADPVNKISFVGLVQTQTPLKSDPFKQSSILVYRALTLDALLENKANDPFAP